MPPLVSICLTCKDRWELTRQALESIASNTPKIFDLIVVDDGSEDKSVANLCDWMKTNCKIAVESFGRYEITFTKDKLGVGGAKNLAVKKSVRHESKYLCLLDNDVVCKPGWLETLVGAYEVGKEWGYRLVGGYTHPFNGTNRSHEFWNASINQNYTLHEKNAVDGLCHFMDWDTWDRFGPYDSHAQGVRQSEDFAFCRKIVDAGYKVGVVYPHVIENHGVVDTFGQKIPGWELVQKELSSVGLRVRNQ